MAVVLFAAIRRDARESLSGRQVQRETGTDSY